jgi:hypothetical protein
LLSSSSSRTTAAADFVVDIGALDTVGSVDFTVALVARILTGGAFGWLFSLTGLLSSLSSLSLEDDDPEEEDALLLDDDADPDEPDEPDEELLESELSESLSLSFAMLACWIFLSYTQYISLTQTYVSLCLYISLLTLSSSIRSLVGLDSSLVVGSTFRIED